MPANSYWFFITIMMNRDYLEKSGDFRVEIGYKTY